MICIPEIVFWSVIAIVAIGLLIWGECTFS